MKSMEMFLFLTVNIQTQAAKEVADKQKKELESLQSMDLSQYSIKGSEQDWDQALGGRSKPGVVSVKRLALK